MNANPAATRPPATRSSPWTLSTRGTRTCVTVACTRCGDIPWDEALGMTASYPSTEHARRELPRDWGWQVTSQPGKAEQVLCPGCAAREPADTGTRPPGDRAGRTRERD